jgi:hypothetical protein
MQILSEGIPHFAWGRQRERYLGCPRTRPKGGDEMTTESRDLYQDGLEEFESLGRITVSFRQGCEACLFDRQPAAEGRQLPV